MLLYIILIIRKQSKKGEILMLDKVIENNRVCIIGEVVSEFTFSHEVFGEGFYIANVLQTVRICGII